MTWTISDYNGPDTEVISSEFPGVKFFVTPDSDYSDPIIDSGCPVDHYVTRAGYHSSTITPRGTLAEIHNRFNDIFDNAIEVTRRYARIFLGYSAEDSESRIGLFNLSGHSQSDWAELFVHVSEDGYGTAEGWAEDWGRWANGDIFGVTKLSACDCGHPHCDIWNESESLWGIYADSPIEAARYFHENH